MWSRVGDAFIALSSIIVLLAACESEDVHALRIARDFDGSYAEYTSVPAEQVQAINTSLDWHVFGALPEMMQTAWGSLTRSLDLQAGQSLLIRGGTTSVGLAAAILAKRKGATVAATTRITDRESMCKNAPVYVQQLS